MTVPRAVTLISVALLIGCQQSLPPQNEVATETPQVSDAEVSDAVRQKAVAAKDALFERLSARLAEVIGKDGPAAAIDVCSTEAAKIAVDVAREQGVEIGRTSFSFAIQRTFHPSGLSRSSNNAFRNLGLLRCQMVVRGHCCRSN